MCAATTQGRTQRRAASWCASTAPQQRGSGRAYRAGALRRDAQDLVAATAPSAMFELDQSDDHAGTADALVPGAGSEFRHVAHRLPGDQLIVENRDGCQAHRPDYGLRVKGP